MTEDNTASGAMPDKRPHPNTVATGDRDPHQEGLPTGSDAVGEGAKGNPSDDRLQGETAHADTARKPDDERPSTGEGG